MKKIMWLCGSAPVTDEQNAPIRPDVMEQILAFKENDGDVAGLMSGGNAMDVQLAEKQLATTHAQGKTPFNLVLHSGSIRQFNQQPTGKTSQVYWRDFMNVYNNNYVFIVLDQDPQVRAHAVRFDIPAIDISANISSDTLIKTMKAVRHRVAQSIPQTL